MGYLQRNAWGICSRMHCPQVFHSCREMFHHSVEYMGHAGKPVNTVLHQKVKGLLV